MRLHPHHVGIIVSDLERSLAFYSALGFEPGVRNSDDAKTIAFVVLGGLELELFHYAETPPRVECEGKVIGFRHLALRTDDVDAALAELKAAGVVAPEIEVREVPGLARLVFFPDPDGIEIEIMQPL